MTFSAIRFLESRINRGAKVFEWGMGGSTGFLLERGASVISVEHDAEWFEKVSTHVGSHSNWTPLLRSAELGDGDQSPSDWFSYGSANLNYRGKTFAGYSSSIDDYPDAAFDFVIIDGRARPSCARHALPKVKLGGHLFWDNTDRKHYAAAMNAIPSANFTQVELPGPTAYATSFTRSTCWIRQQAVT